MSSSVQAREAGEDAPGAFLLVISGASGSGKSSVCNGLLARAPESYALSVSATTRAPRKGEVDGRHYHFLERAEFEARIVAGELLEYAEVFGRLYGTPRTNLEVASAAGKVLLLDIDVQGGARLREAGLPGLWVWIDPPSPEVLEARLRARSTDDDAEIARRLTSAANESEGEFRARLQDAASEARDLAIAKIRQRYSSKVTTLENRLLRPEQSIAVQKEQSTKKKLDTAVSFGTAILGAVLGRKRISSTSASKMGTAIKTASSARKEAADVERAKATADKVRADIAELSSALEKEVADLDTAFDAQSETLDEIVIRAKSTDIHVAITGLVWLPYVAGEKGRMQPAW